MKIIYYALPLLLSLPLFAASPIAPAPGKNVEKAEIALLLKELEDENPKVRENAVYQIWDEYTNKKPDLELIKALEKRLSDNEKHVRYFSAAYVLYFDVYRNIVINRTLTISLCIEALNEALNDKNFDLKVIERIIIYLPDGKENLGAKRNEVISALKKHLNSEHKLIRYKAAAALGELDYANNKELLMPVFLKVLFNTDTDKDAAASRSKTQVVKACKSIGPEAIEALPGLLQVMKEHIKERPILLIFPTPFYIKAIASVTATPLILIIINDIFSYPAVNLFIMVCFGWLFWWSLKLREKGEKVFHWFLPVPALYYAGYLVYNIFARPNSSFELLHNYKIFIVLASVGLIPWLISRLLPRRPWSPDRKNPV
ncbi:MAG: hypothetical protein HY796_00005 [Elusimicrobia bacterium]|nr:hypothetical protein [Elusimicrobiota bacterium]